MPPPIIEVRGLGKRFSRAGKEVVALQGFDLSVAEGEFIAIVGPSGCGKSTFLHMLGGFEPITQGQLLFNGKPVTAPGPDRGDSVSGIRPLSLAHRRGQYHLGPRGAGKEPPGAARGGGSPARQGRADALSRSLSGRAVGRHETASRDRADARLSIHACS